jgi:ADP-heptose:LPS heptosyltransferase
MSSSARGPLRAGDRLLVVRLDNLGDVILLGPALRALHSALPGLRIELLASPAGAPAAELLPWVDDVLVEQVSWQDATGALSFDPGREARLVARLADGDYDAALIFTSWAQSPWPAASACYAAGIRVRAGESKEFGGSLLSHRVPCLPDEVHQVERNLHLVRSLGVPSAGSQLEIEVPGAAHDEAAQLRREAGVDQPYVVVAPGASCAARRYPAERFADVVTGLAERLGRPVVVVGTERDRASASPVVAARGAVDLIGRTSIGGVAALLQSASLAVTNDSGPMHLAAAVATPQVVLYAGTELVSQWAPTHVSARLLRVPTWCTPCFRFDCPYELACLDVAPAVVVDAAVELIGGRLPERTL